MQGYSALMCTDCATECCVLWRYGTAQDIDIKRRKSMAAISRGLTTPNLPPGVTLQRQARSVGKVASPTRQSHSLISCQNLLDSMQMKVQCHATFLKCITCRAAASLLPNPATGLSWIKRCAIIFRPWLLSSLSR